MRPGYSVVSGRRGGSAHVNFRAAGAGKTTLLATWLAAQPRPGGLGGLDSADGELTAFVRYMAAAVQQIAPSSAMLHWGYCTCRSSRPSPLAATLLDELAALPAASILVLDDYHVDPGRHDP